MIRRNYSNTAAITALSAAITSAATSLSVNSANGYPAVPFTIRCEGEIILVGAVSATTFSSLTRGYDSTIAAAHALGAVVEHRAVRDDFSYRWIDSVSDKTATNASTDHFDNASLDPAWLQVTPSGTVTWTEQNDVLSAKYKNNSANHCVALVKSLGALSYPVVVTSAIRYLGVGNYNMSGLIFTNGATTAATGIWAMPYQDGAYGINHELRTGTLTTMTTNIITGRRPHFLSGWMYQRLIWRAANTWSYEISPDGVSWTDYANGNEAFTLTPTHFGFGVSSWGSTVDQISTFEYFDVTTTLPS